MGASNMPATCVIDFMLAYTEISAGHEEARTHPINLAESYFWSSTSLIEQSSFPEAITNDPRRDKTVKVADSNTLCEQKKSSVFGAPVDLEPKVKSMTVPDPDFHNVDKDRTERSFDDNQVWASYDDDDGMPRYYAMNHNVISKKPFEVQFS
ncbi:hypothetical protein RND71_012719 [Anisodus tanguticus]|uniref:DUF3444 domain-containing protein n=1 Tax=Anisodus tanguticus TaxID=243964 RepID=A0AAE1SGA4_9SOLA|nr:hypothetical protein RND71_012719 [Anisodus tanguticus]